MAKHKALTYVMVGERKVAPGQFTSDDELKKAGQSKEQIEDLIANKALGGKDDPINDAHLPVEVLVQGGAEVIDVVSSEDGTGYDTNA